MMSDDKGSAPIPWGLVEHVNRTKTGMTTMQISLSIETRARLAQAALDLGCSKLALIRASISQFMISHERDRSRGQERAYAATREVTPPPGPTMASELVEPEQEPEPEPEQPERAIEPEQAPEQEPEQEPAPRKPSRSRKKSS